MALFPKSALYYPSLGLANQGVIKGTEAVILALSIENLNVQKHWLQLYNSATKTQASLVDVYPVLGGGFTILDSGYYTSFGQNFPTGIYWGWSSAPLTFIPGQAVDCLLKVRYL